MRGRGDGQGAFEGGEAMTRVLASIDIDDAMREAFEGFGIASCAPPVPADIGSALPHVMPWALPGTRINPVEDAFELSIDVRAATWGEAARTAGTVCGIVRSLGGTTLGGVPCYGADVTRTPYHNPDPDHPTIPRYTLAARVYARVREVEA